MKKKAQIWVETVMYTLIGLSIIAIILTLANPQIEKMKDRSLINQAKGVLTVIDNKISWVSMDVGRVAQIDFNIARGKLIINSTNDSLKFILENSPLVYSQLDSIVKDGDLSVLTTKVGSKYTITMTRYYNDVDITFQNNPTFDKIFNPGSVSNRIRIENRGTPDLNKLDVIDFNTL